MAKKIDLQALHQQINELQIDKDLNRGKLHSLSEKFTIFEHEGNIETIPRIELALIIIGGCIHIYLLNKPLVFSGVSLTISRQI